jgi:hypothetical protein
MHRIRRVRIFFQILSGEIRSPMAVNRIYKKLRSLAFILLYSITGIGFLKLKILKTIHTLHTQLVRVSL